MLKKSVCVLTACLLTQIVCTSDTYANSFTTTSRNSKNAATSSPQKKRRHPKKVVNADVVRTKKLLVKENAQFCGDVAIKGNLSVSGEITEVRNPFHGWWRKLSKGDDAVYGFSPQYIFINASDIDNITAQGFGGTLAYAFEYADPNQSINPFPTVLVNDRVLGFLIDISVTATVNGVTGTFPDNLNFYFTLQEGGQFDGLGYMSNYSPAANDFFQLSAQGNLYEKLAFDVAVGDQIRPWGNGDNAFTNSNSRRFMFEQIDQIFFENNTPALSPAGQADLLMERPERLALRDAILNEGVERDAVDLYTIHKTTKGSGTTTLFTRETFPYVSFASKVTLCGLKGAWKKLNGIEFQVVGIANTDCETVQEQAPFFLPEVRTYHILITVDTSDLPDFDPCVHAPKGVKIKPSKVGPITEDIEYREWADAAIYYTLRVMQQSTHGGFSSYLESLGSGFKNAIDTRLTKAPLATWNDVTATLAGDLPSSLMEYRYRAGGLRGSLIAPSYYLPYRIGLANIQINEPFQELGIPGSDFLPEFFPSYAIGTPNQLPIFGYNVPFENYLLPESRRWLYFRVKPNTPVTNAQQENVWANAYDSDGNLIPEVRGYASVGPDGLNTGGQLGGSLFEGLMSSVPWGEADSTIEGGFWSPYTDLDQNDPTTFNAGMIDPALVGGRRIGYIQTALNILHDPFYISLYINFGNPELAQSSDPEMRKRQQYDAETAVIAELMRYFVQELKVEAIILDNRINGGGFGTQSFYEAFGGARLGGTSFSAFQAQDNRNAFNVDKEIDVFGAPTGSTDLTIRRLVDTTPWPTVRPDLMEARYPGSVFKNGPVIILDSQSAGSGGDQFPRYFMGDALDGNIGNGVQTHVVGTIHGLLSGYSAPSTPMVLSKYGSEFPVEVDGELIGASPVLARGENLIYNEIAGVPSSTRTDPNTGELIKALIPVNSGLKGPIYSPTNTCKSKPKHLTTGALSTNISDTVYFDFGYTGSGTAVDGTPYADGHWNNPPTGLDQVDGFPGQPDPADPLSLRDSWFEEAIRVTRLSLGDTLKKGSHNKAGIRATAHSSLGKQVAQRFKTVEDVQAHCALKENPETMKSTRKKHQPRTR